MIVLDASAVIELLLWSERGRDVADRMRSASSVHVPELLGVEVAQVVRRLVATGAVTAAEGAELVERAALLDAEHYRHGLLIGRAFELRENLTAYDGVYVALAEALGAPLLTFDARLRRAPGHRARVELP